MLYFPQTRVEQSVERAVAAGALITAEGAALVGDVTSGLYGVKLSTGTSADNFAGVSVNMVTPNTTVPQIQETAVAATTFDIFLPSDPVPGSLRVVRIADGQVYTEDVAAAATKYNIDDTNPRRLIFVAGDVAKAFRITFRYSPTALQSMLLQGNIIPGGPAGQFLGQVGVITRGDVYTTEWDTTGDWAAAVSVVLLANGLFGPTATLSAGLRGVQILEKPSAGRSYLGLNINAAA